MRLGSLDLSRVVPDVLTAASIRNDCARLDEPAREYAALAALGVCVRGPDDWPTPRPVEAWTSYGRRVRAYLELQGAPLADALTAGWSAAQALSLQSEVDERRVEELRDFFGLRPVGASSTDSDSGADTSAAPSMG